MTSSQKKLKLSLNESISLIDLPKEILAKILKLAYDFPMLFNLCRINRQFNEFIHNYFKNIGIVDVNKYLKMDKSIHIVRTRSSHRYRNFKEQIDQIVGVRNHTLSGIKFKQPFIAPACSVPGVVSALEMCVDKDSFEVLHVDFSDCRGHISMTESFRNVVEFKAMHLKELNLNSNHCSSLNLSSLVNLKSLTIDGCHLTCLPVSIMTLKYQCYKHHTLLELHALLSPVAMELVNVTLFLVVDDHRNRNIGYELLKPLNMPKLRQLKLDNSCGIVIPEADRSMLEIDLSKSLNITSIESYMSCLRPILLDLSNYESLAIFKDHNNDVPLASIPITWNNLKEFSVFSSRNMELALEILTNNYPQLESVLLQRGLYDITAQNCAALVAAIYKNDNINFNDILVYGKRRMRPDDVTVCKLQFSKTLLDLISSGHNINSRSLSLSVRSDWCSSTCEHDVNLFNSLIANLNDCYLLKIICSHYNDQFSTFKARREALA